MKVQTSGGNGGAGASMSGLVAYIEGEGQSNMVGYVSFSTAGFTNSSDYGDYASGTDTVSGGVPIYQTDILSGGGTLSVAYTWRDFILIPSGQSRTDSVTSASETGPYGDTSVASGGASNSTSAFGGIAKAVKANGLFAGASSLRFLKTAYPGKHIDYFRQWVTAASREPAPMNGYRQRTEAMRSHLRSYVKANGPIYMQASIWWQGEQNTGAGSPVAGSVNGPRFAGVDVVGNIAPNGDGTSTVTVTTNNGTANGWQNVMAVGHTVNTTTAGLPSGVTVTDVSGWGSGAAGATFKISGSYTLSGLTIRTGNTADPDIANYATLWQEIDAYNQAQLGVNPPKFLISLTKEWYGTDSTVLDPYKVALNAQLKSLCAWTVTIDASGNLTAVTANNNGGASNRYYVDHPFAGNGASPGIHITGQQQQYLGLGIAAALQYINGASGASTAYAISAVLPMWRLAPVVGTPAYNSVPITYQPDSTTTVYWAAVAHGGSAPSAAAIKAGTGFLAAGNFAWTSGSGTDGEYGASGTAPATGATATLTGLSASTAYDLYFVLYDATNALYSPVASSANITTAAAPSNPSTWDTTFNTATQLTYSNSNKTVTRTDATGTRSVRSTGQASASVSYAEILCANAMSFVGMGDNSFNTSGAGGTSGISRVGWTGSNLVYDNAGATANQAMGGSVVANDVIQIVYDSSVKKFWMRRNGTGNWNNTAGATPPATGAGSGTGGLDCSGLASAPYLVASLGTTSGYAATIRTAVADWTQAPTWATSANQWVG